ncbi:GGDEF domain-containing protein [Neiella marina]|uniref:GGDEF domain-containing protein n=1 Tax=Neiella holothuriorum TaxID=2870530 RepID=A0ABS7EEL3_9GAMM|nr:GGDEF domain-containing protein [Neiella holothuriorum]MBW8190695.1 GGDEF domain-containing protein [Neiella holothuriorum]
MSAVAKLKLTTWVLFALCAIVMLIITIMNLNQALQSDGQRALQMARGIIIDTTTSAPDWQPLERQFALYQLTITDLDSNQTLLDYQRPVRFTMPASLLSNLTIDGHHNITVRGYNVQLSLDHSSALAQTANTILFCFITLTALAVLLSLLLQRGNRQQVKLDHQNLEAALLKISKLETHAVLPETTSEAMKQLDKPLSLVVQKVVTPLLVKNEEIATLQRHAFHDDLTGFGNKNLFKEEMMHLLQQSSVTNYGLLVIMRANALGAINDESGYAAGDDYIKQLVTVIEGATAHFQRFSCYRLNTSDLAVVFNFEAKKEHQKIAQLYTGLINELARKLGKEELANVGITDFQSGDNVSELLARCDNALSLATTRSGNSWHFSDSPISQAEQGKQQWRSVILNIIEESRVTLYGQPQMALNDNTSVYTELQARFVDANGEPLSTASLIAQAQSNDLMIQLDKTIIEHAVELARNTAPYTDNYAINLSNSSIMDAHFCIWLERQLLRDPSITRRLVFEVSEHGLTSDISAGRRIIDIIHRVGARFTIEHFGTSILSLKYFRELNPDWVKLDASHTAELEQDRKLQYFIRTLVDITHQMGVRVIAEAVETVEQKQLLDTLNIDVIQGYFVGKPEPIESPDETTISFES